MIAASSCGGGGERTMAETTSEAALSERLAQAMQALLDAVPEGRRRVTAHAEPNGSGGFRFWFLSKPG
jgi:hypothetical protein